MQPPRRRLPQPIDLPGCPVNPAFYTARGRLALWYLDSLLASPAASPPLQPVQLAPPARLVVRPWSLVMATVCAIALPAAAAGGYWQSWSVYGEL